VRERILEFIRGDGNGGDSFETLALAVFAHQYERIELYRRLCDARGLSPANVERSIDVPAVPADLFKHDFGGADSDACARVFLSSGTTQGAALRSRHVLTELETYRESSLRHFAAMVMRDEPGPMSVLILGPTARSHPSSSLGCMFSWCAEVHGDGDATTTFTADGGFALTTAVDALRASAADKRPVLILALSSALSAVLDELRSRGTATRLPADSRIVHTGGNKPSAAGRRVLSPNGMLKACWRWLHVPAYACINEYGMTELLSQFYDDALVSRCEGRLDARSKAGPHWVRSDVVDPTTLTPVGAGAAGILRHFDLANWESVSAIQTLDMGRARGRGFELLGRATGAEARGCSQLLEAIAD
jgi:phenylacetate-coenzyme A ligase PaaK-like adenylate-forming protein